MIVLEIFCDNLFIVLWNTLERCRTKNLVQGEKLKQTGE